MASPQSCQNQYHHFIPQFILKNFSHKYNPRLSNHKAASRRRKKNKEAKLYPGDPVLHIIDLKGEVPQLSESPVRRTFGLMDMYRDISNASDHHYLEKEIGKLESRVSSVLAEIRKAFEGGKTGFSMSRHQRDMLRKFLFIMKYRGPNFYQRFHGNESGAYNEDDADRFKSYMQEKGYQNPVDVWFTSIKTILNLDLDLEGRWQNELRSKIYPDDAMWFIIHMEWYFLTFCTPDDPIDEFILTENCYNVHEGPSSTVMNPETGEHEVISWSSYHEFSPITPRLMLILRSALLPNAEEDANESVKTWRRNMYEQNRNFHFNPATAASTLEDLPLRKPRNSYSQVRPDGIQLLPGEDGSRRSNHRFTFPFIKINTDQVHRINCIFFDNAYLTSAIGFNTEPSLKRSLEYYLELPADRGYKVVYGEDSDLRLAYLKKLESITKSLGSNVVMLYKKADTEKLREESLRQLQKEMLENLPEQPSEFMQLYSNLGGSRDTIFTDMDQVRKMRYLRIEIDVATQGLHESKRVKVRENLRDIFCQLPPRRLWMYLKSLRVMSLGSQGTLDDKLSDEYMDGPEDVIVKASQVVRPECLGLLLHFTVMQDIQHKLNPGLNPSSHFAGDEAGLERTLKITRLTFNTVGSICDCGIKRIQEIAIPVSSMLRLTKSYEQYMHPAWNVDQNIEILTRAYVRMDMMSIFSRELSEEMVEELSDVLFNVVYPAYTKGQKD